MSKTQHTPGPWHIRVPLGGASSASEIRAENGELLGVIHSHLPLEINDANARLMCAAPDLLEACKTALALLEVRMESGAGSFDFDARDQMRAAIAKAEGG